MKKHLFYSNQILWITLILAASGCQSRRGALQARGTAPATSASSTIPSISKEAGQKIVTSTGLPYWPPGPVYMVDAPTGFEKVALLPPLTSVPPMQVPPPLLNPPPRPFRLPKFSNEWVEASKSWMGTPYRVGGQSRNGIDCSGYAAQLHLDVNKTALPHTTSAQRDISVAIGIGTFQPGDLLFFNTQGEGNPTHVGVYLGERMFTHAGASSGVTTASLDDSYWASRFLGARRINR
ncbi:MAG: hypothetical protein EXS25_06385 [Pedosphaera sp.]|nr:hypothetical protein [Pedosphaera sp.]